MDDLKARISSLSDAKIKECISSDEADFQPGVYALYIKEAEGRGIRVEAEKAKTNQTKQTIDAPLWKRFFNYFIDYGFLYLLFIAIFSYPVRNAVLSPIYALFMGIPLFVLYFIVCEYKFGKTLGKLITGTKIVTNEYTTPNIQCIVKRTFSRLIPFNTWITLFTHQSIHDRIAKTICVEDKKLSSKNG